MSGTPVSSAWAMPAVGRSAAPLRLQVVDVLRTAILTLDLQPGQRLVERELIERLEVSRSTVREALRELESEGLVQVIPQRGAVVASLSHEDAADLYEARVAIEALLVRRFVERADDGQIDALQRAIGAYAAACERDGDTRGMLAAKDQVYAVLTDGASDSLRELLGSLNGRLRHLRARTLSQPGRPRQSAQELRDIGEAIARRDVAAAVEHTSSHVKTAAQGWLDALEDPTPTG
ncbi:MAG: GntR family transcriptional regulator [Actinomycetes bacterium]